MTVASLSAQRGAMTLPRPAGFVWRAYFAPVNRATNAPAVFDPARDGNFDLEAPPAPWIACGAVANLTRIAGTKLNAIVSGPRAAASTQFRSKVEARIEFEFLEWGKLQMALSAGSQHMNLLAEANGASAAPSGGAGAAKVPVLAGSSATEIVVGGANIGGFSVGDLVAIDIDYTGQTGYVGSGASAAHVKNASDVGNDQHYIRRVTFNVGRIRAKTTSTLQLAQPLLASPTTAMSVQRILGFVDREGGSFFTEWSALFVCEAETGGRVCIHYPRVQPAIPAAESTEAAGAIAMLALHTSLIALPTTDPNDNEQVLCYRSFIPAANAAVY